MNYLSELQVPINQRFQCNTAKHLMTHISLNTRRKIRKPMINNDALINI
jgi:hypothetical protein